MDAILAKLLEHAPTWAAIVMAVLVIIGALVVQSVKLVKFISEKFDRVNERLDKQDKRQDEQEDVLVGTGLAGIEERVGGTRRLVAAIHVDMTDMPHPLNGHLK